MDTIYRKEKYQELIKKINKLQGLNPSESIDGKYALLQNEVNEIIENLRNRGDQTNSKLHFILLLVPLSIVLIIHAYLFSTYLINISVLILAILALGIAHYRMGKVIKQSQERKTKNNVATGDTKQFIITKMNFLEQALAIKKSRLLLVSIFYILFFPILLVFLHEVSMGSTAFDSPWMAYLVAYLVAASLWYFYYNRVFEAYDEIDVTLDYIRTSLES